MLELLWCSVQQTVQAGSSPCFSVQANRQTGRSRGAASRQPSRQAAFSISVQGLRPEHPPDSRELRQPEGQPFHREGPRRSQSFDCVVFCLGSLVYVIITRRKPHETEIAIETVGKIKGEGRMKEKRRQEKQTDPKFRNHPHATASQHSPSSPSLLCLCVSSFICSLCPLLLYSCPPGPLPVRLSTHRCHPVRLLLSLGLL